jgi:sugar lactone lactonase YvrE
VPSKGPSPTLNPANYQSRSRQYSLFVDPSDPYGRGKGTYRQTRAGIDVWSAEKPYSLWKAVVADDGSVAGYAYSHGWDGFSEAGYKAGRGDFRIVIIDPHGKERLDLATKREDSPFPHFAPNPLAAGVILDEANDRLVVRVADADVNRQAESWWSYQLSTGKEFTKFRPKELMADSQPVRYVMDAEPVAGTPLTLIHWWRYDWEKEQKRGARFALIGPEGKEVWSLDLPLDYDTGDDEKAGETLTASLRRSGGILSSDRPGRFELRFVRDAQRVTFRVSRLASGTWSVSEVQRRPFVETALAPPKPAEIPLLALRPAGRIVLTSPSPAPEPEVRDVSDFEIDGAGRIAVLRRSEKPWMALVVVDQQGKVLHTVRLDSAHAEDSATWSALTCVGLGRYLLIRDAPTGEKHMEAAVVDVATQKVTPVAAFTTTVLSEVAGFRDGGFVVKGGLSYFRGGATSDDGLRAFDSKGKRLWELPGNGDFNDPAALFGPKDVTVTTDGMIAVIDVIRKTVQFFERTGKHHHTVDLKKAWGREPNYPSDLSADRDGGVVVEDFQGNPPIVRMSADGTVRAQVKPRLQDGSTFSLRCARVAPGGALWVSDGHALYRIADSGLVDRVLGEAPDPQRLEDADSVTVDSLGRIYAVAGRTGAVHVFAPDGRWLRVCVPATGDVPGELAFPCITVAGSGDVYLGLDMLGDHRYLHFSPEGKRVGIESTKLNDVSETWYAQPGTGRRWVLGYENVYLIDGSGAVVRTIMRRADGFWLTHPDTASAAADGSIAVVSGAGGIHQDGAIAVSLYSPQGEPIRTFKLPPADEWSDPRIAYNGKRLVVAGDKAIVLFEASGKALGLITPPPGPGACWTPFLAPDGRALLLFDGRKTLHRFEL